MTHQAIRHIDGHFGNICPKAQEGIMVKGRFAPSPTGRMHLGNILSAFLSYLSAKSQGGQWLLRIEDLDQGRSRTEFARQLEEDLLWLGLEWDEGGLDNAEYCQSKRGEIYEHYCSLLEEQGLTYPCWCSRADLMASSAPHQSDGRVVYAGTCRPRKDFRPGENGVGFYAADGSYRDCSRKAATRIMVPDREITIVDRHYGPVSENLARDCGDFIIKRADGTAAYQLAVVVDDALMGVTEVVRGCDLLQSAPQQAWLHETLGFEAPAFAHLPLLCAHDGRRLCKRDKSLDMGELRKRYTPGHMLGLLAQLSGLIQGSDIRQGNDSGHGRDSKRIIDMDNPPYMSLEEIIPLFSWSKVPLDNIVL